MTSANEPERLHPTVMAMIVARDFQDGDSVNLGVGLPLECANVLPPDREILLHSELGLLGFGPVIDDYREADPYVTMVGTNPVTKLPGMSFMSHDESFAMVRGGHLDVVVLGGLQVDVEGNLANTHLEGKPAANPGGAPDLAYGAKRTVVMMRHTTGTGAPKIVIRCTLPLTAVRCVSRIVTDIAVIDVEEGQMILREHAPGWDVEHIQALTEAPLLVADDLREVSLV